MRLKPKYNNTKSYLDFIQAEKKLVFNGVSSQNFVYESGQFLYSMAKTRRKVPNRLQSKLVLCKIDDL